jgi:hypothetical protein
MNTNLAVNPNSFECKKELSRMRLSTRYIGQWLNSNNEAERFLGWTYVIKLARYNKCLPDGYFSRFLPILKRQIWKNPLYLQKANLEVLATIALRSPILLTKVNQVLKEINREYYLG